ncbi:hypothetical protein ACLOJK_019349, partial [Asimina triloba]
VTPKHYSRRWGHCSCDDVFNAHGVGRRRGSLWARHAIAVIADILNGEQLAAGDGGHDSVEAVPRRRRARATT